MIQSNYFTDNSDLVLQVEQIANWNEIVKEVEDGFRDAKTYESSKDDHFAMAPANTKDAIDYYYSVLDSLGELMGKEVAPRSAEMDKIGLKYDNGKVVYPDAQNYLYNLMRESGLMPIGFSRKYGGLRLPVSMGSIIIEIAARADSAFCLAFGNVNVAEIVERYGSDEMRDAWIPKFASGEISCAMALTEPNYGSDLPNVQTRAVKDEKGVWRITGAKRFITHAAGYIDAPCAILTLARTGSPTSGARGLSFFLVEAKDVHIAGIEKKMGLHCSPTCEVVYENSPGLLIGEEGFGLVKYSMGMMNSARVTIAAQSVGVAQAAYAEGKKYAAERIQFGKPIKDIPAVAKMLDRMERELAAMRCVVFEAGRCVDMYIWRKEHFKHEGLSEKEAKADEQIKKWEKLADLFTPLSKYYASEQCVKVAYDAVQIHGGSGFTEDYDVARIYRDARILTIYEGTSQLQVVAAIGGVAAGMAPNGFLREYFETELKTFTQSAELKKVFEEFDKVAQLYRSIEESRIKAEHAWETVESAARYILGLLMERSAAKLKGEQKSERLDLCRDFNIDSLAIIAGNLVKLEFARAKDSVKA
ncbi:MAG: acyl-CoA dehydrogenase family protein [Leptospira sp.]|nr:acyl-CoA dehydrogenase family protein [Leptospira sp.]